MHTVGEYVPGGGGHGGMREVEAYRSIQDAVGKVRGRERGREREREREAYFVHTHIIYTYSEDSGHAGLPR